MKAMKTPKIFIAALAVAALSSCEKKDDETTQQTEKPSQESTEDIATSMSIDEEITTFGQMSMEGEVDGKKSASASSCITYSIDTTGPTNEITLDFGTTNCAGSDGKLRRGKLVITIEDNPFDVGSITTVTSDGYTVNNHEVTGSKTMTYQGFNSNNDPYIDLVSNLSIERPDGKIVTWNSNQTRIWTDGFADFDPYNNAVEITGTASGLTADSIAYNIAILTPLRVEATCSNIVSGSFKLSSPVFADRTFDYGNGTCDNVATVTVNGNTYTFTF